MMQIKVWPQAVQEEDLGILMTLPKHEIAQTLDTASAHKEVEGRVFGSIHVSFKGVNGDGLGVGELRGVGGVVEMMRWRIGREGGG